MSQHDTLTLEPCPFCGGSAKFHADEQGFSAFLRVRCTSCGSSGPVITYGITENGIDHDSCESRYVPSNYRKSEAARPWNARRAALSATQPAQAAQPESVKGDKPYKLTPYNPTDRMRQAMKRIDPALSHDQCRALWAAALLRRVPAIEAESAEWRKQADTLTHQVICCGVAASHPDPELTKHGAYAGKWNSAQAEEVRKLRAERDQLRAELEKVRAPDGWKLVPVEPTPEMIHAVRFAGDPDRPAIGERIVAGETAFPFVGADVARRMCIAMLAATHTPPAHKSFAELYGANKEDIAEQAAILNDELTAQAAADARDAAVPAWVVSTAREVVLNLGPQEVILRYATEADTNRAHTALSTHQQGEL